MCAKTAGVMDKNISIDELEYVAKEKFPECTITIEKHAWIGPARIISGLKDGEKSFNGQVMVFKDNFASGEEEATETIVNISLCPNGTNIIWALVEEFGGKMIPDNSTEDAAQVNVPKKSTVDWTGYEKFLKDKKKAKRKVEAEFKRRKDNLEKRKETILSNLYEVESELIALRSEQSRAF